MSKTDNAWASQITLLIISNGMGARRFYNMGVELTKDKGEEMLAAGAKAQVRTMKSQAEFDSLPCWFAQGLACYRETSA